ncbi:hypothetical protein [Hubei tetragnatha maxillosa virus 7]|uniref:hypothetical protein n=1 Tax=Hubei tetragnatha maxillosa virus 7 TaxID=1923249 RepID=UPI00090B9022|nr:hypothetical protein [Hubei tetragnatha maxillosa virus 7]APG77332.1 hypothetical protein [Hubei tetragnatha maxillosa virus 7]
MAGKPNQRRVSRRRRTSSAGPGNRSRSASRNSQNSRKPRSPSVNSRKQLPGTSGSPTSKTSPRSILTLSDSGITTLSKAEGINFVKRSVRTSLSNNTYNYVTVIRPCGIKGDGLARTTREGENPYAGYFLLLSEKPPTGVSSVLLLIWNLLLSIIQSYGYTGPYQLLCKMYGYYRSTSRLLSNYESMGPSLASDTNYGRFFVWLSAKLSRDAVGPKLCEATGFADVNELEASVEKMQKGYACFKGVSEEQHKMSPNTKIPFGICFTGYANALSSAFSNRYPNFFKQNSDGAFNQLTKDPTKVSRSTKTGQVSKFIKTAIRSDFTVKQIQDALEYVANHPKVESDNEEAENEQQQEDDVLEKLGATHLADLPTAENVGTGVKIGGVTEDESNTDGKKDGSTV